MSLRKKRILLLLLSTLLLLGLSTRLKPIDRELWHADLLEQMEKTDDFSEFCDLLFRYGVTADSITTAYTLRDPSAYGIPALPPRLLETGSGRKSAKKQASVTRSTASLLLNKMCELKVPEGDASLTYSLLEKQLKLSQALSNYPYYEEMLGESTGVFASLPVAFGEYPLHGEEDIETYLSLLAQVPDCFRAVTDYENERARKGIPTPSFLLRKSADSLAQLISDLEQDDCFLISTFEERLRQVPQLEDSKKKRYLKKNRKLIRCRVLPAYRKLLAYVESMLPSEMQRKEAETPDQPRIQHSPTAPGRQRREADNRVNLRLPASSTTFGLSQKSTPLSASLRAGAYQGNPFPAAEIASPQSSSSMNIMYLPEKDVSYGLSSLPDGKAYYSLLVQKNTGSSRTVDELIRLADERLSAAMEDVTRVLMTDQAAYQYYLEHPNPSGYEDPETILEVLPLMIRKDFPQLEGDVSWQIKQIPEKMASFSSPAFFMIPEIDNCSDHAIYLNPLFSAEDQGSLFTTLAHEGFPGHLYQTASFYSTHPPLIRHLMDFPGYAEGWAAYAELHSITYLHFPAGEAALQTLYQSDLLINLALCARMDLGVNAQGWTLHDACRLFEENGFKSYYAAELYSHVVEAPAAYLRYYVGLEEILALKEEFRKLYRGDHMELDFHTALLQTGPGDFETIRKAWHIQ